MAELSPTAKPAPSRAPAAAAILAVSMFMWLWLCDRGGAAAAAAAAALQLQNVPQWREKHQRVCGRDPGARSSSRAAGLALSTLCTIKRLCSKFEAFNAALHFRLQPNRWSQR